MEKSAKTHTLRERFVPLVLVFIGLLCASWFSIQKNDPSLHRVAVSNEIAPADTIIKKKTKRAPWNKKQNADSPKSVPQPQQSESKPADVQTFQYPQALPFPQFDMDIVLAPMLENTLADLHLPPMPFGPDLHQGIHYSPKDFANFKHDFEEKFEQHFGDFYRKNESEIQKMMQELQREYGQDKSRDLQELQKQLEERSADLENINRHMHERSELLKGQSKDLAALSERMNDWQIQNLPRFKDFETDMKDFEEKMRAFQVKLKAELVKDGYLKSGEEIDHMHWRPNGDIEINGTPIKESDRWKYIDLHEKHFEKDHDSVQPEK